MKWSRTTAATERIATSSTARVIETPVVVSGTAGSGCVTFLEVLCSGFGNNKRAHGLANKRPGKEQQAGETREPSEDIAWRMELLRLR